jgi:hypothetical protein
MFHLEAQEEWACREACKHRGAKPTSMKSQGRGTPKKSCAGEGGSTTEHDRQLLWHLRENEIVAGEVTPPQRALV